MTIQELALEYSKAFEVATRPNGHDVLDIVLAELKTILKSREVQS